MRTLDPSKLRQLLSLDTDTLHAAIKMHPGRENLLAKLGQGAGNMLGSLRSRKLGGRPVFRLSGGERFVADNAEPLFIPLGSVTTAGAADATLALDNLDRNVCGHVVIVDPSGLVDLVKNVSVDGVIDPLFAAATGTQLVVPADVIKWDSDASIQPKGIWLPPSTRKTSITVHLTGAGTAYIGLFGYISGRYGKFAQPDFINALSVGVERDDDDND